MTIKLFKGVYIIITPKSDRKYILKRAIRFMDEYFGEAQKTNPAERMLDRKMGFEDGYEACMQDLKIEFRYDKVKR